MRLLARFFLRRDKGPLTVEPEEIREFYERGLYEYDLFRTAVVNWTHRIYAEQLAAGRVNPSVAHAAGVRAR
jgi:hypothetical protein